MIKGTVEAIFRVIYYIIARLYFQFNVRGSTRLLMLISEKLPIRVGKLDHPLGFSWNIDSRESLHTYLASCEVFTSKLLSSSSHEWDSFVCIGANRGWYPLLLGQFNSKIEIVAFECNSKTLKLLENNLSENHSRAKVFEIAIGQHQSKVKLYGYPNSNDGMSTLYPTLENGLISEAVEDVEVDTLDSLLINNEYDFKKVLVLMDIEGGEFLALKGGKEFFSRLKPTLVCEINPILLKAAGSSSQELMQNLYDLNYESFWIDERGKLQKVLDFQELPHLKILPQGSGANYLFIQPHESWADSFK